MLWGNGGAGECHLAKTGEKCAGKTHLHNNQVFDLSVLPQGGSKCFDDDGRLKRTGTVWTASAHIITAVIGSGVLSLAWATAQFGWIASPAVMFLFSFVTYYTSTLLAACYRCDDPVNGKRNYTYMDAVKICGWVQYLNLFGVAIGYIIASSISMMAIKRSNCFHESGGKNPFHMNSSPCRIALGIAEIIFSQVPDFGFPLLLLSCPSVTQQLGLDLLLELLKYTDMALPPSYRCHTGKLGYVQDTLGYDKKKEFDTVKKPELENGHQRTLAMKKRREEVVPQRAVSLGLY
ncbi:hypothetical protein PVK06_004171 [Gossypium arboreum]|uniref:Amino acid transporter transmembrane domain-containing protein n=1 Tax=Gossypium arboreum TaxID=29729 RepID=A0ABR0QSI8_GOSAR|nr:hypothetical protein PVK06_004171 [Gossypium arboreum]